jgi:hypothetical protein
VLEGVERGGLPARNASVHGRRITVGAMPP